MCGTTPPLIMDLSVNFQDTELQGGGTFCPRSFDDMETSDQQANAKKANVIFNFLGGDFGTETIKRGWGVQI